MKYDLKCLSVPLRANPIDNQRGEFEYYYNGLLYAELEAKQELIGIEEL